MNNLAASIGLAQLEQLDGFVSKRRQINANYKKLLSPLEGLTFQKDSESTKANFWLTGVLIDEKITGISNECLRITLMKKGIETRFLWKPLHMQPVFKKTPYYGGNNAENMFKRGLCLPSSANLTFADQQKIAAVFLEELIKTF
jgi:dTDP-4-amino-4,6-dideoxygalactose transaminase